MKYAGGIAFERMGISRSSSWPMVTITGAGATCAACCAGGRVADGLFAARAVMGSNIVRLARVNVFTRDAPEFRFFNCAKFLVYAYALPISNSRLPLFRPLQVRAYQRLDAFAWPSVARCQVIISTCGDGDHSLRQETRATTTRAWIIRKLL